MASAHRYISGIKQLYKTDSGYLVPRAKGPCLAVADETSWFQWINVYIVNSV